MSDEYVVSGELVSVSRGQHVHYYTSFTGGSSYEVHWCAECECIVHGECDHSQWPCRAEDKPLPQEGKHERRH